MTLVVFGTTGQVACGLRGVLGPDAVFLGRDRVDFTDPDQARAAIAAHSPQAVINAVAYTAVDRAEEEPDLAHQINAVTPGAIAQACAAKDIPLVHISTDYVFDGQGDAPRAPDAPTGPLQVYGASKLAGEEAIRAASGPHAILRTSWVFSPWGQNFALTMLRLGATRDALNVVDDQVGGPTPASAIAAACATIARVLQKAPQKTGTYHFSGQGDVSWAGFARAIFQGAGLDVALTPIPTSAYPTPATRPLNSRLDCQSLRDAFAIARPDWRDGLAEVLAAHIPQKDALS